MMSVDTRSLPSGLAVSTGAHHAGVVPKRMLRPKISFFIFMIIMVRWLFGLVIVRYVMQS